VYNMPSRQGDAMQSRVKERYKELCEHAEVVNDPKKLQKLTEQINRILKSEVALLKRLPNIKVNPDRHRSQGH
jgi:thymidylate kinase